MTDQLSIFDQPRPGNNLPEFTVSEIAGGIKKTLEDAFGRVRVRGEICQPKLHTSGHLYFDLKDENALIASVCWKGNVNRLPLRPEHGMEVVATGRVTTYGKTSKYQLVVEEMALAGAGALLALLEARKAKLKAEGLFERKRPLPFLPRRIGVITSETGAVIRDILHRLEDRFPLPVLLWPVAVQGPNAAAQITAAIEGMNNLPPHLSPDLIIVARGGGSLEDLMAFNEENVVRAAAASAIPLISAVGHETDTTLIDFASDRRAPTPTAAAEIAVPVRRDLLLTVDDYSRRLTQALQAQQERGKLQLHSAARALSDPRRLVEASMQRLDDTTDRLGQALRTRMDRQRQQVAGLRVPNLAALVGHAQQRLASGSERLNANIVTLFSRRQQQLAAQRLPSLALQLANAEQHLQKSTAPLARSMQALLDKQQARLEHAGALLESHSYQKVLERGFALVRKGGVPVTQAAALRAGDAIEITFGDGSKAAEIKS